MKMLSLDDAIKAVTMLLDDTDGIDKIRSCDVINNLKYAPSVEEIEPAQKWISVKDRLPETNDEVLTTYIVNGDKTKRFVETASYCDDTDGEGILDFTLGRIHSAWDTAGSHRVDAYAETV